MGGLCSKQAQDAAAAPTANSSRSRENEKNRDEVAEKSMTLSTMDFTGNDDNDNDIDDREMYMTARSILLNSLAEISNNVVDYHHEVINNNDDSNNLKGSINDSMIFFDAIMSTTTKGNNESFSNTIMSSMEYPPTSSMLSSATTKLSLNIPTSLLSQRNLQLVIEEEDHDDEKIILEEETEVIESMKKPTKSVIAISHDLDKRLPSSTSSTLKGKRGYPGELTETEVQACLDFRQQLKTLHNGIYKEIVHVYGPIECEAFALCRFLRSRSFQVSNVIEMLNERNVITIWNDAKKHDFYSNFQQYFHNCPLEVFLTQFPILVSGVGKNGATIIYFKAGDINMDGIECIQDMTNLIPFVWNFLYKEGKQSLERESKLHDSEKVTILAERIIVIDMKGISSALFGSRGIDFIKSAAVATSCFPELVNRIYILNAPMSFSIVWSVLKLFMEPRTLQKIGFFSNAKKAKQHLLECIDSDELLSDYGGNGSSFSTILEERQQEYGTFHRIIVHMIIVSTKETKIECMIADNESVDNITVYTKADHGADFTVKMGKEILVSTTSINKKTSGNGNRHYSIQLNMKHKLSGSAKFDVLASKGCKENFLVVVPVHKRNNEGR